MCHMATLQLFGETQWFVKVHENRHVQRDENMIAKYFIVNVYENLVNGSPNKEQKEHHMV